MFFDLEPDAIDQVKNSEYKILFDKRNFVSGKEGTASNFNRGMYTIGKEIIEKCLNLIRKSVERCDKFQGFIANLSSCGGTGSGFGGLLMERLSVDYGKKQKIGNVIMPSQNFGDNVVQAYNTVLSIHCFLEHIDLFSYFENEALYRICSSNLQIENPNYRDINRIIAQYVSSFTLNMRFREGLNTQMDQIVTNLSPYPRIKFVVPSVAPFVYKDNQYMEKMDIETITETVFDPIQNFANCDTSRGKTISNWIQYRGEVSPREVQEALASIQEINQSQAVDYNKNQFK